MNGGKGCKECYPLSLKDMCTIEHIPRLIEAGIDSFKIEGRMKRPEYASFSREAPHREQMVICVLTWSFSPGNRSRIKRSTPKSWTITASSPANRASGNRVKEKVIGGCPNPGQLLSL